MIKKTDIVWEDGIQYVYQPINFKPDIMREYYVGDQFIGLTARPDLDEEELSSLCEKAGINGFMPELVRELKEDVIGIDNQKYDGYELGKKTPEDIIDEVNFYFLIRKSEYSRIMRQVKYWSIAKGLDHLIYLEEKMENVVTSNVYP